MRPSRGSSAGTSAPAPSTIGSAIFSCSSRAAAFRTRGSSPSQSTMRARRAAARCEEVGAEGHRPNRAGERGGDGGMHQPADLAAEARDLPHQARAQVREVHRRDQEDRFERRVQPPVHQRHLELVLEVAHRPQPSDDDGGADPLGELGEQAVERLDGDPRVAADRLPQHAEALLHREERLLGAVGGDRHDHLVRQREAPAHQVLVALRRRIERARVQRDPGHGARQKVTAVSP